jgi:hypothetical protein
MLIISIVSSVAAAGITYRLWGGWIAGFFAILSFDWLQRSYLGCLWPFFSQHSGLFGGNDGPWHRCWHRARPSCGRSAFLP